MALWKFLPCPECCTCAIGCDATFDCHSEDDYGSEIQTIDPAWDCRSGTWTLVYIVVPFTTLVGQEEPTPNWGEITWQWYDPPGEWRRVSGTCHYSPECNPRPPEQRGQYNGETLITYCPEGKGVQTSDSNALLIHEGPSDCTGIVLQVSFRGHHTGDVIHLVFDYQDDDNYKYLNAVIGANSIQRGELSVWERVAGSDTQKTPVVYSPSLVPGEYLDRDYRTLGVCITRAVIATEEDPVVMITGQEGSWNNGWTWRSTSYYGYVNHVKVGIGTGDITGTLVFDNFSARRHRYDEIEPTDYRSNCYGCRPRAQQTPCESADLADVTVNSGSIINGDKTFTYVSGTPDPAHPLFPDDKSLILAPGGGSLDAIFDFELVNPKPTSVWLLGRYDVPGVTDADIPWLDVRVYNFDRSQWEQTPWDYRWKTPSGWSDEYQSAHWPRWQPGDGYLVEYAQNRTHIHGFLIHHVDAGLLRLRFTSDPEHVHSFDNRMVVQVCRAYGGWDFPAEWDVTIPNCSYLPGLVGTHRLTMQEGYSWGPWVKEFGFAEKGRWYLALNVYLNTGWSNTTTVSIFLIHIEGGIYQPGWATDYWYWWPDDGVPPSNCWLFNKTTKSRNSGGIVTGHITFSAVGP